MLRCQPSQITVSTSELASLDRRLAAREATRLAARLAASAHRRMPTKQHVSSNSGTSTARWIHLGLHPSPARAIERAVVELDPEMYSPSLASRACDDDTLTPVPNKSKTDSAHHLPHGFPVSFVPTIDDSNVFTVSTLIGDEEGSVDLSREAADALIGVARSLHNSTVNSPAAPRLAAPKSTPPRSSPCRGSPRVDRQQHVPSNVHYPAVDTRLDPESPVFLPTTRLANSSACQSPTRNLAQTSESSLDFYLPDLRLRPSLEANGRREQRLLARELLHPELVATQAQQRSPVAPVENRRRRAHEETRSSDPSTSLPNLERFPLVAARPSRLNRLPALHNARVTSRVRSRTFRSVREEQQHTAHSPSLVLTQSNIMNADSAAETPPSELAPSPTLSSGSFSTPNLLHAPFNAPRIHQRTSSIGQTRISSSTASETHRMPSIVSAASGISTSPVLSSRTPSFGDAAIEFLRGRNSPLDDLTERLSRVSATLPVTCVSPVRTQASSPLLNGSPFRSSPSPMPSSPPYQPVTPKFKVYNDAGPPQTQPQTPADMQKDMNRRTYPATAPRNQCAGRLEVRLRSNSDV